MKNKKVDDKKSHNKRREWVAPRLVIIDVESNTLATGAGTGGDRSTYS